MIQQLDRSQQPQPEKLNHIPITAPQQLHLDNGIPVYLIKAGTQELVKIELIFKAGTWFQQTKLQAFLTNRMLREGSKQLSSAQIAEKVDYYGAYLETSTEKDTAYIALYTLNKHLKSTLSLLEEVIKNPQYPKQELDLLIRNQKQQYTVNCQKVSYLARTYFSSVLFGAEHPYGRFLEEPDFDRVKRTDLIHFYQHHYHSGNCTILAAGQLPNNLHEQLNKHFGGTDWAHTYRPQIQETALAPSEQRHHNIPRADALQSAIRIGRPLFNKTHPDFHGLQVLNTILGGYFGSRLMTNIREDKGYTYSIGSAVISYQQSGYFIISTEVGAEVTEPALQQIYLELNRLIDTPVPQSELDLVKNYMLGGFMRGIDGPIALSDKFREVMDYGLDQTYYDDYIDVVRNISPAELQQLASVYFQPELLRELVVGKSTARK